MYKPKLQLAFAYLVLFFSIVLILNLEMKDGGTIANLLFNF